MKIGIITYTSLHCNFTNYGTVLQAWALNKSINRILTKGKQRSNGNQDVILIDYCPDSMIGKNPLSPFENMWDLDEESRKQAQATLPAIKDNLIKINDFYKKQFCLSQNTYTSQNFEQIKNREGIDKFVIGSDSIWDIEEFGIDNVFFANIPIMSNNSIAYAPSFQDSIENFERQDWEDAKKMIRDNFISVALRDHKASKIIEEETSEKYPVVADPTLTLEVSDYSEIESKEPQHQSPYILYYSRRYNSDAEKMVKEIANDKNLEIVEISLRAENGNFNDMRYDAGIEEFLTLVKNSEIVITNSFHCMIFAILYHKDFYVYSRQHCYGKIVELLDKLGLSSRFIDNPSKFSYQGDINYLEVDKKLDELRRYSNEYLQKAIEKLL